ncbi:MAG: argininosuccinate lyase [Vicinamibacteria bacterium]|jgi:hypothetical protein|nr:argininosuccinate lyase [Vicinamibacteria bacterium]
MNLSKRLFAILGLGLAVTLAINPTVILAGDQDFVLINRTGYDIDEVYVALPNQKDWGEDIMESDTLDNGQKVTIQFSHKEKECNWDMRIVFSDGEEAIWEDFDLCTVSEITLRYEGKRPTATFK